MVPFYLLLLTARGGKENLLKGIEAGADDFIHQALRQGTPARRVEAVMRSVEGQSRLVGRIVELSNALRRALEFRQQLPVCGRCKRLRVEDGTWHEVPRLAEHDLEGDFNSLACPDCAAKEPAQ